MLVCSRSYSDRIVMCSCSRLCIWQGAATGGMGSLELLHSVIKPRYTVRPYRFLRNRPCHSTTATRQHCFLPRSDHHGVRLVPWHAAPNSLRSPWHRPFCLRTLRLTHTLSRHEPDSELHRSLAGIVGVSPIPIVSRSHLKHISPRTLSRLAVTHLVYYHYTMYYPTVKTLYRFPSMTS